MARTAAVLPNGARITDYISLGVVTSTFGAERVKRILAETGRESIRQRDLPAHVVVYYVIALSVYMQVSCREALRCLLEGLQWLSKPGTKVQVAGKSGISQARSRLGLEPIKRLHDETVLQEILEARVESSRGRRSPRGVKRKMSSYPIRSRSVSCTTRMDVVKHILALK